MSQTIALKTARAENAGMDRSTLGFIILIAAGLVAPASPASAADSTKATSL